MKNIIVSINTKFIHTNLAVRYLKANTEADTTLLEFTIKDSNEEIVKTISSYDISTVAFSTYIWNIEKIKVIVKLLRELKPNIKIILGGPEVSYECDYFFNTLPIDYIIRNEGELTYNLLVTGTDVSVIPNLVYKSNNELVYTPLKEISDLNSLKSPYYFEEDIPHLKNKIQYIETSRGCPFSCAYCMASLEKRVRYFELDRVKKDITYLLEHGARIFKFLDRTFNTKVDYALEMFRFLIDNQRPNVSFQFEITLDILDRKVIDFLNENAPSGLFRFEVGIQSTNVETNRLVDRIQNNEKLFHNIDLIHAGNVIDLHLDLIAGLPREDFKSFENTFNEVFAKRPKELQLGFLKLLRGTKLRNIRDQFKYEFDHNSPYEIISNDSISNEELGKIHLVEESLEKLWNSGFMINTLNHIFEHYDNPFQLFLKFGEYYDERYDWHKYQLDELFSRFYEFTKQYNIEHVLDYLKLDYFTHSKVKPKIWWEDRLSKETKNYILRNLFEKDKTIKLNDLYKYAVVENFVDTFLIVVYQPNNKQILMFG